MAVPATAATISAVAVGANSRMLAMTEKPPSRKPPWTTLKKCPAWSDTMVPQPTPVSSRGMKQAVRMNFDWSRNSSK